MPTADRGVFLFSSMISLDGKNSDRYLYLWALLISHISYG